ncbi:hypothetical protein Tco_1156035 [Tanacetum coccineum]
MSGSDDDAPPPPPPPPQSQTPVVAQAPHTMSTIKHPILKKGEYDIWAMKMEHYLVHTDYPLWKVIQKGNGPANVFIDTHGIMKVLPPKTAEETLSREREREARTTLLLALLEDHLAKFNKMTDAKEIKRLEKKEESNALMTLDGGCVDWTSHSEDEQDNYAFMACNSLGSDIEIHKADSSQQWLGSPRETNTIRKRKRPQPDVDSDDEHRKCLKIVTFEGTIDSEIMETKSFISKLDKVSSPEGDYLVVYRVNGNFRAFNYLMEGDLKIMMESSIEVTDQGDFWNDQQDWEIVTWRLYEACGVCILEFKDGTVIHMLVERKYPLSKELLQRMLDFGLEVEVESTAALDLIRVLNSPCFMVKSWLVQDQTVLGKDYSNLLIADSLLKTIWFINAPCYGNEALASPKANGVCCDAEEMRCKFKIESESKIPVNTARDSGTNNVSTARHNFNSQAVLTNAARKISIVKPFMNKVNIAEVNAVSAVRRKRKPVVKPSTGCNLRTKRVLNSPCFMVKSWLVQDQTVFGKDYSNLLKANSLLKTIWFINAPCYGNKALASPKANELTIPEQTATGKGISNPLMAGSLPKTTKLT